MLQLVVNNNQQKLCCKNSCELFDSITNECGVRKNIDPSSSKTVYQCADFIPKQHVTAPSFEEELFMDEEEDYVFQEFQGEKRSESTSLYPVQPDSSANRDDAIWYVAPDQSFGCWIINHYQKRFMPVQTVVEEGWAKNIYKSPVPLHDHGSPQPIASKMAWYVDREGFGQYVLLANGRISYISAPNPNL